MVKVLNPLDIIMNGYTSAFLFLDHLVHVRFASPSPSTSKERGDIVCSADPVCVKNGMHFSCFHDISLDTHWI